MYRTLVAAIITLKFIPDVIYMREAGRVSLPRRHSVLRGRFVHI
jgi:hypothetical protein